MTEPELTRGSVHSRGALDGAAHPCFHSLRVGVALVPEKGAGSSLRPRQGPGDKVAGESGDGREDLEPTALGNSEERAARVPAAFPSLTLGF